MSLGQHFGSHLVRLITIELVGSHLALIERPVHQQHGLQFSLSHEDIGRGETQLVDVLLMQLFEQVEERLRQIVYERRGCHYGWILFEQLFEREKTTLFQHQPVGIGFRGGIMTVFLFQF